MKITRDEVEAEFRSLWPDIEYIWLWDKGYWKGTKDQVERLMEKSRLKDVQFVPEFFDCDDFAAQFKEEVRRTRYYAWKDGLFGDDPPVPYAVFFAGGDMFRGVGEVHAVNLLLLRDPEPGVWIVDMTPQERIIWKANPQTDNVYFISS